MHTVLLPFIVAIFIGEWWQRSNHVQSDLVPSGGWDTRGGQSTEHFFCKFISFGGGVAILSILKVKR